MEVLFVLVQVLGAFIGGFAVGMVVSKTPWYQDAHPRPVKVQWRMRFIEEDSVRSMIIDWSPELPIPARGDTLWLPLGGLEGNGLEVTDVQFGYDIHAITILFKQ